MCITSMSLHTYIEKILSPLSYAVVGKIQPLLKGGHYSTCTIRFGNAIIGSCIWVVIKAVKSQGCSEGPNFHYN
jgi:hypothetical protein